LKNAVKIAAASEVSPPNPCWTPASGIQNQGGLSTPPLQHTH